MYANVFKCYLFMQNNVYLVDLNTGAKQPKKFVSPQVKWRSNLDQVL